MAKFFTESDDGSEVSAGEDTDTDSDVEGLRIIKQLASLTTDHVHNRFIGKPGELNCKPELLDELFGQLDRPPVKLVSGNPVIHVETEAACDKMVSEIFDNHTFIGYDAEHYCYNKDVPWKDWPPQYKFGRKPYEHETCWGNFIRVMQFALTSGKTFVVDLFKISNPSPIPKPDNSSFECDLPKSLMRLLTSKDVTKFVFDEINELDLYDNTIHHGVEEFTQSMIDIKPSCKTLSKYTKHSLGQMVYSIFGVKKARKGKGRNWNVSNLNDAQIEYAALDALMTLDLAAAISVLSTDREDWMKKLLEAILGSPLPSKYKDM